MRKAVYLIACCLALSSLGDSPANAQGGKKETYNRAARRTQEIKLHEFHGFGGVGFCVWATNSEDGSLTRVQVRRSRNGHPKILGRVRDRGCWESKSGIYVVYGTPLDHDAIIHIRF
jgi:hypothetical protein